MAIITKLIAGIRISFVRFGGIVAPWLMQTNCMYEAVHVQISWLILIYIHNVKID